MMNMFLLNLAFAVVWLVAYGDYSLSSYAVGFLIGFLILTLYCHKTKNRYTVRLGHSIWLFFFFHYELITSSVKVLWDIITPGQANKPGFIALELDAKTPLEIFFTANLISLTPGTLSIALSDTYKTLYIHAMFIDDVEETVKSLKRFESVVLGAFR